jgi:hypothetical protein
MFCTALKRSAPVVYFCCGVEWLALYYTVLHCIGLYCSILYHTVPQPWRVPRTDFPLPSLVFAYQPIPYCVLWCGAVWCGYSAISLHCSVLRCAVVRCYFLRHIRTVLTLSKPPTYSSEGKLMFSNAALQLSCRGLCVGAM